MKVTIAALTFRREADLELLLPQLIVQAESVPNEVDILVVDNDPDAGARTLVAPFTRHGVRYSHEPEPGIAAGRNRALDETEASDVLIFVDDDERPSDAWLSRLLSAHRSSGAAGVAGPVVSRFSRPLDGWVAAGRFFDRRRYPTGAAVPAAATNNLLLDLRVVRRSGIRFRQQFSLSGGSDTMFTRELIAAGESISWCDEAVVYDVVPEARMTRHWVLRRAFRSANSWSRVEVALQRSSIARSRARLALTARGVARYLVGTVFGVVGAVTRRTWAHARGARMASRGRGMIAGAWGRVYTEYARPTEPDSESPSERTLPSRPVARR